MGASPSARRPLLPLARLPAGRDPRAPPASTCGHRAVPARMLGVRAPPSARLRAKLALVRSTRVASPPTTSMSTAIAAEKRPRPVCENGCGTVNVNSLRHASRADVCICIGDRNRNAASFSHHTLVSFGPAYTTYSGSPARTGHEKCNRSVIHVILPCQGQNRYSPFDSGRRKVSSFLNLCFSVSEESVNIGLWPSKYSR